MLLLALIIILFHKKIEETWEWVQHRGQFCSDLHENYTSLSEAKSVCKSDTTCGMIYSKQCDPARGYQLCSTTSRKQESSVNSCLHVKEGIILLFIFIFPTSVYQQLKIVNKDN